MENLIIIAIIAVMAFFGIRSAVGHFKGQGGCCGGGSYKPKKKKLEKVLYTKQFYVDGMSCEHCKNRVEGAVNDIHGLAARVDLKKGIMTVSYAAETGDELIRQKVERAGYSLRSL